MSNSVDSEQKAAFASEFIGFLSEKIEPTQKTLEATSEEAQSELAANADLEDPFG